VNDNSLYPALLAPCTLAGKPLRNRLMHASMTTLMGGNQRVTDQLIQYHANRAHRTKGGAALIVTEHQPIACDNNPRVGAKDEVDWWPPRALQPKRVVVVDAGVAGMEAAWVAAARGHAVTVFSASDFRVRRAALVGTFKRRCA
jgi:2,4-dienoyl-CoA reductase-like NADH-dependent reductase (Old Yellow Enzyme family)